MNMQLWTLNAMLVSKCNTCVVSMVVHIVLCYNEMEYIY